MEYLKYRETFLFFSICNLQGYNVISKLPHIVELLLAIGSMKIDLKEF